jgi:hypothetical protein
MQPLTETSESDKPVFLTLGDIQLNPAHNEALALLAQLRGTNPLALELQQQELAKLTSERDKAIAALRKAETELATIKRRLRTLMGEEGEDNGK